MGRASRSVVGRRDRSERGRDVVKAIEEVLNAIVSGNLLGCFFWVKWM